MQSTTKKPTEFFPQSLAVRAARAATTIAPFISQEQAIAIANGMQGEDKNHFLQLAVDLADRVDSMPSTYEPDGKGDNATVYLHYFIGDSDWFITEKDENGGVDQAFGYAVLNGNDQFAELGDISIRELTYRGVELDLYFRPRPLAEIKVERERYAA
ncbi:hypothetical protein A1353_18875 [Methylomonas methanica]|uniref:DUF2958 family protein n=1 Tax=Methylomonas methanica TaxID=421 RepID=A0A177M679_METMH|nr:hypothetical protein [Methylomonas methanica]OAI00875.1 hypothetical protein A1353_18875 [Methylomonas methanica]